MKAVVFDMDGVIVDSERQWKEAAREFLREVATGWGENDDRHAVGLAVDDLYEYARRERNCRLTKERFLSRCDELAREVYLKRVSLADGFLILVEELRRRQVPLAVASSSPKAWIDLVFERFRLGIHFPVVVSGDDIPQGRRKPHPAPYLTTAKRLGIPAHLCLAVEDSSHGILAAKAAGMTCAAYVTPFNESHDLSKADFKVRGFRGEGQAALISRLS